MIFDSIESIKNIYPSVDIKFINYLKLLNIKMIWDLISNIPSGYEYYPEDLPKNLINQKGTIKIIIKEISNIKLKPIYVTCECEDKTIITIVFFNKTNYINKLSIGSKWIIRGKIEKDNTGYKSFGYKMIHPDIFPDFIKQSPHQISYKLSKNITIKKISYIMQKIIIHLPDIDWIKNDILLQNSWPSWKDAIIKLHNPIAIDDIRPSALHIRRLAFDELLAQQILFIREKSIANQSSAVKCIPSNTYINKFLYNFGFSLTIEQERVWQEILKDMSSATAMMRIIHGEVGSGKTVLAVLTALLAVESGMQAAILAPTEILAIQHFDFISKMIPELKVDIFLSKIKKKYSDLENGYTNIAIGTHALLQEKILFKNLGVVVIDEQHRFGVAQRLKLIQKGQAVHTLLLSATPIPRTMENVLYGNIDISKLHSKVSKTNTKTYIINENRICEIEDWIEKCIFRGERVYWVCSLIDDKKNSVIFREKELSKRFSGLTSVLHSKMKKDEKIFIINQFKDGIKPIIVSTTVIEVGVHVDAASTIIIENSERFGLSQLHQLRGRVGRANIPGHCFLIYSNNISYIGKQRLKIMRDSSNGFHIAEQDWKIRGGGDIVGTQQSGYIDYKFVDLEHHSDLIDQAKEYANYLYKNEQSSDLLLKLFHRNIDGILYAG